MIVMKFGGTSVENAAAIRRLVAIVQKQLHCRPLVVVSAMGKTTNKLLDCATDAAQGQLPTALTKLEGIEQHHHQTADELVLPAKVAELHGALAEPFEHLRELLAVISQAGQLTPQFSDAVSSYGELLSSLVVAAALRTIGINSVRVDIRPLLQTNDDYTRAIVDFDLSYQQLQAGFTPIFAEGNVPITQGFIGSTAAGVTTTIGRGGSDYSAAIIGAALDAEEIQIWTDVDGIMTADPRIIPTATKLEIVSFEVASELAYFGAKVLHPSTLLPAMEKDIPVRVCNSSRPEGTGTKIVYHETTPNDQFGSHPVRAIAFKRGITVINVSTTRMLLAVGFLADLFSIFKLHQTAVDMVATSEVSVSVTLDDTRYLDRIKHDLEALVKKPEYVSVNSDQALICLVGEGLKTTVGMAKRIFSCLDGINISMISHGASASNVSFVVKDTDAEVAVQKLHWELFDSEMRRYRAEAEAPISVSA